jgi:hypothetical protein
MMDHSVEEQRNKVRDISNRSRALRKKCNKLSLRETISDIKSFIEHCNSTKKKALNNQDFIVADSCEDESLTWALRIRSFFDVIPYKFSTISRQSGRARQHHRWHQIQIPITLQYPFELNESIKFFEKDLGIKPYFYNIGGSDCNICYRIVDPGRNIFDDLLEKIEKEGFSWVDKIKNLPSSILKLPQKPSTFYGVATTINEKQKFSSLRSDVRTENKNLSDELLKCFEPKPHFVSNIYFIMPYQNANKQLATHITLSAVISSSPYNKTAEQIV